jgi:hypothetical protein
MSSHHAVLITADEPLLYTSHDWESIPSYDITKIPQLGIHEVRQLIATAHRLPDNTATERILVVATEYVTEEAQQALLKIIEEPPDSTQFIFVVPVGYRFLPTLESRFERVGALKDTQDTEVFQVFLAASYKERQERIADALADKDQRWQMELKRGLVSYLQKKRLTLPLITVVELEYIVRVLLTRGASNKFLLEHLALTLPVS